MTSLGSNDVGPQSGLLAVTYERATALASRVAIEGRERSLGANIVREFDFAHAGLVQHVLSVAPAQEAAVANALRSEQGVRSVSETGERRFPATVSTSYFTNDPYFDGFPTTLPPTPGSETYHVAPYEESAEVPGQWNMHAVELEHAFEYSQPNNGSNVTNGNALGSSSVKIAVIDTGEDSTHPELSGKIVYQKCFITDSSGTQSSSNFSTDEVGHGTDVSGIAAAATNNDFGFAGAGGNSVLYAYRVYPTPDDNCAKPDSSDTQCSANTIDIASAINDAVANGANVITLSLGGGGCTNGSEGDSVEGNAVTDALDDNVVVFASAGNGGASAGQAVEAPACDAGVIAVGASALADGNTNGSGVSGGSASSQIEYVASYSDYGSPAAAVHSSSAWGIVAPGGDPLGDNDTDDLHWIEDLWTSTPLDGNFDGECRDDYPNATETMPPVDCRTQIAGTSMSSPHAAGVAALIIAVNSAYQSPSKMKQLLCETADDIGAAHEGCGRLNAYRAMAYALGDSSPP